MAKKRNPFNSDTSWEEKVQALTVLKENNFNMMQTAKQLNMKYDTLRTWRKRYSHKVFPDIEKEKEPIHLKTHYDTAISKAADKLQKGEEDFVSQVLKTKLAVIKRLESLVEKEKNMSRLTGALDLLHKITQEDKYGDTSEGKVINTYLTLIKEQYKL